MALCRCAIKRQFWLMMLARTLGKCRSPVNENQFSEWSRVTEGHHITARLQLDWRANHWVRGMSQYSCRWEVRRARIPVPFERRSCAGRGVTCCGREGGVRAAQGVEAEEYVEFLNRTLWDTYQVIAPAHPPTLRPSVSVSFA